LEIVYINPLQLVIFLILLLLIKLNLILEDYMEVQFWN